MGGVVFAVNRKYLGAGTGRFGHYEFAGNHQHFFIRERDPLALSNSLKRRF